MKRVRRLLCLLLSLAFAAALLPPTAHADSLPTTACRGSADGHDWQPYDFVTYATCTENGTYLYICLNCGETAPGPTGEIPALGHSWSGWQTGGDNFGTYHQAPTCTAGGEEFRSCSRCGETETRQAGALGHAWNGGTVTREAGCTAAGSADYTCTRCGATETRAIAALGHAWDGGTVIREAACDADGERRFTCTRCGETRSEDIPATGHDWVAGETAAPEGIYDGSAAYTCARCGETKTEGIPVIPADFFASLRNIPVDAQNASDLQITQQPMGAVIQRDSGEIVTITVGVTGGVEPYTYEWHAKSFEEEDKSTPITLSMANVAADLNSIYKGAAFDWYGAHAAVFDDVFNADWLHTVTETAGGSMGDLLGSLDLFDKDLGSSEGPEYTTTRGNCDYWVEITDAAGDSVTSEGARVVYDLRIARQPHSVNWRTEAVDDEFVRLECAAADGTGEYEYAWYMEGDTIPYGTDNPCEIMDLGTYYCRVTDVYLGTVLETERVEVYDDEPFRIYSSPPNATLWPEEEWELSATVEGGVPPYEVWWDSNGTPLLTEESGLDDQGRTVYRADGAAPGLYTLHATDSMGATDTRTTYRYDRQLTISRQPVDGELPLNGYVEVGAAVTDGEAPYLYVLYRDGKATMQKQTDGVFQVWHTGEYYIRVEDSRGHYAISDTVRVENEKFRVTDYSAAAEITQAGKGVRLFIEVSGGKKPYSHTWLELTEDGWEIHKLGAQSAFYAWRPGTYACRVTDDNGIARYREMQVTYAGDAPLIITQPDSVYMENGATQTLRCKAVSGSGDGSLKYNWEWSSSGSTWYLLKDKGQEISASAVGFYRCRVTDTVTGKYTYSNAAAVTEEFVYQRCERIGLPSNATALERSLAGNSFTYDFYFTGGSGPYTVKIYQNRYYYLKAFGGMETVLYRTITVNSIDELHPLRFTFPSRDQFYVEKNGEMVQHTEFGEYYLVVTDAAGHTCQTQEVRYDK